MRNDDKSEEIVLPLSLNWRITKRCYPTDSAYTHIAADRGSGDLKNVFALKAHVRFRETMIVLGTYVRKIVHVTPERQPSYLCAFSANQYFISKI